VDFNSATNTAKSSEWRTCSWMDKIEAANLGTQHHTMPQLMVNGWECIFTPNGQQ